MIRIPKKKARADEVGMVCNVNHAPADEILVLFFVHQYPRLVRVAGQVKLMDGGTDPSTPRCPFGDDSTGSLAEIAV